MPTPTNDPRKPWGGYGDWDTNRAKMDAMNFVFGAGGTGAGSMAGKAIGHTAASAGGGGMLGWLAAASQSVGKDLAARSITAVPEYLKNQAGQVAATNALAKATAAAGQGGMSTPMKLGLGLGAGALGLGALLNSMKHTSAVQEIADASDKGRVRVKLPTNKLAPF